MFIVNGIKVTKCPECDNTKSFGINEMDSRSAKIVCQMASCRHTWKITFGQK